jgi:hypothetical protein
MAIHRNCAGMSRRDCIQAGLGSLFGFGFGLVGGLRARATEAPAAPKATANSCILIWMDGGPTHFETFDPKPDAPAEYRGEFQAIATRTPGVLFSEHLARLASISHKFAVVRSIRHDQANHGAGNHYLMTGAPPRIPVGCGAFVSFHPSMGSVVAHERGGKNGLPPYFALPEMPRSGGPNFLGARHAPFVVGGDPNHPHFQVRDVVLPPSLTDDRFARRRDLRRQLDRLQRFAEPEAGDPAASVDQHYQQGCDLMFSKEAQAAFDLQRESPRVRDAYGRHPFGQRALLARRLVEAGVPFVTLYDGGWDHHRDLFPDLKKRLPSWDAVVSTLLNDLDDRGLLKSTLVLALGEFGRTPKISLDGNANQPGRDHWANAMSVLVAGGGTPGGLVVGATDAKGHSACDRILSPENFVSTVYAKLGIDPGKILYSPNGRPNHLVSDPTPIQELMG